MRLHFAELVYNASNARQMNVSINGVNVLTNFDIYATVGAKNRACVQNFATVADTTGKITIVFTAVTSLCCINGIEVLMPPILPGDVPLPGWAEGVTPMDGGGAGGSGPSSADGVNLASGVYENNPGVEIGARNPVGPSPVFARSYRSKNAAIGYNSPGLPLGWTHNYDVIVQAKFGKSGPLMLKYPNGATEQWELGPRGSSGNVVLHPPTGTPYAVSGITDSSPTSKTGWQSLTMKFKDESRWTFTSGTGTTFLLTQITNLAGRSILINYTSGNILSSITDDSHLLNPTVPAKSLLGFTYNTNNLLKEIAEYSDPANPRHILYSYGNYGAFSVSQVVPIAVLLPPVQWQYTGSFLSSVSVPDPRRGTSGLIGNAISYDPYRRVQSIADANGNQHVYTYGKTTQVQTINSTLTFASFTQKFDSLNRDTGAIDVTNNQTSVYYDDPGNPYQPTRVVNRNGQTALMDYDSTYGNLLYTEVPCAGGQLTTNYTYDHTSFAPGRLSSVQEGGKTPTSIAYYTNNTVVSVGGVSITQPNGLVRQVTSPRPGGGGTVTTTYIYTTLGNVLAITLPGPNGQVTYTYNYTSDGAYSASEALGEPLTVTDPLGHTTHYRYDARGNLSAVMDAIGRETDYTYNDADQLLQVTYPPKGSTSPGRSYVKYTYLYPGASLQQTEFFDETGTRVRSVLRMAGREDEDKKQSGSTEQATLAYDPAYRLKTLTDGNNHSFNHSYDLKGNLTQFSHPLANASTHFDITTGVYDNDDNITQLTDGKNQTINYTLAPDDSRLTDIQYPANTLGTTHYDYDAYGRVVHRSDVAGNYAFSYDDLDNLLATATTYVGQNTNSVSYTYNPDGSRSSMTAPAGTYTYHYDDAGRMTSVSFPWGETISYTYDNANRTISQYQSKFTTSYVYDGLDNLLDLNQFANTPAQTVMAHFYNMSYDAVGNRLSMYITTPVLSVYGNPYDASGFTFWTYDTIGKQSQLTNEFASRTFLPYPNGGGNVNYTENYQSDAADNLIQIRGGGTSYNSDNQPYGYGGVVSRDGNGNSLFYSHDPNDRITSFGTYRDDGLRAWKGQTYKTYYVYDGTRIIYEYGPNGSFAYGYGATGLVQTARYSGSPSPIYTTYTFDPMGNVVSRYAPTTPPDYPFDLSAYDAFGQLRGYRNNTGATLTQNPPDAVGYGGQWGNYTDLETGLVLMTYRFYDPVSCRFLTRDPMGYNGGINLYAYCRNNPINCFDPLGLDGNVIQFLIGEAKGAWNLNISESMAGQLGRLLTGNQNFGKILSTNSDQEDGDTFNTALLFFGSFFVGGEANAAKVVANEGSVGLLARMKNKVFTHIWDGQTIVRHQASIRVVENSSTIFKTRGVSGMMTAAEKAMGKRGTWASHTEARACRMIPLNSKRTMYITSKSSPPCGSCQDWMKTTAKATGAKIIYRWRAGGITHTWTP